MRKLKLIIPFLILSLFHGQNGYPISPWEIGLKENLAAPALQENIFESFQAETVFLRTEFNTPAVDHWVEQVSGLFEPFDYDSYQNEKNRFEAAMEIWKKVEVALIQLISKRKFPNIQEGYEGPEDLNELRLIGIRLDEAWKEKKLHFALGSFSTKVMLIEGIFWDNEHILKKIRIRTEALSRSGTLEDRLLALWIRGVENGLHLRNFGMHFDPSWAGSLRTKIREGRKREFLDNDLLIQTAHEYIKLLISMKEKGKWEAVLNHSPGYEGELLQFKDILLWGLIVMLEPLNHHYERHIAAYDETVELGREIWESPERAMEEALLGILTGHEGVSVRQVEDLLIEAFSREEGDWFRLGLRSPFSAALKGRPEFDPTKEMVKTYTRDYPAPVVDFVFTAAFLRESLDYNSGKIGFLYQEHPLSNSPLEVIMSNQTADEHYRSFFTEDPFRNLFPRLAQQLLGEPASVHDTSILSLRLQSA